MSAWTEKTLVERIVDRDTQMADDKRPYEPMHDLIREFVLPEFPVSRAADGKYGLSETRVDGEAAYGAEVMANGIITNLVSPSVDWRMFRMRGTKWRHDKGVNVWLRKMDDAMGDAYRRTNYYDAVLDFMLLGVTIGSPVLMCDEDVVNGEHNFWIPDTRDVRLMQDDMGQDSILHVTHHYKVLDIWEKFGRGKGKANLPRSIHEAMRNGQHTVKRDVIQAVYRRTDALLDGLPSVRDESGNEARDSLPKSPWLAVYVLKGDKDLKRPLAIRPYIHKPFSVFHWRRLHNNTYAVTPAWKALTDILQSQSIHRDWLMGSELKVKPPLYVVQSLLARMQAWPGGVTAVTSDEYERPPKPVFDQSDLNIAREAFDYFDDRVARWFMVHFFMQLTQMLNKRSGFPTATEVMQLSAEKLNIVLPSVEKIERKLLATTDDLMFEMEARAGRLPLDEAPPALMDEAQGRMVKPVPEFIGKLARLQMHVAALQKAEAMVAAATPWVTIDQKSALKFKVPTVLDHIAEDTDFYPDAMLSQDEFDAEVLKIERAAQAAQMAETGPKIAAAVRDLSGPVDESSLLASGAQV